MEAAISASIKVNANHQIVAQCAGAGSLQINEFLPLLAHALIESMELLATVNTMLASHVDNIKVNGPLCEQYAHKSITLITAFLPFIGYEKAEHIVKEFESVKDINFIQFLESKLGSELVKKVVTPESLMALGFK